MNNSVKVKCMHFWSDWTDIKEIEINLDEYVFFEVVYRGKDSWHIIGHKVDKNLEWTEEELSDHQVSSIYDLAKFIAQANAYDNGYFQPCKVSRFNNTHYFDGFYDELSRLFELVKKVELTKCAEGSLHQDGSRSIEIKQETRRVHEVQTMEKEL